MLEKDDQILYVDKNEKIKNTTCGIISMSVTKFLTRIKQIIITDNSKNDEPEGHENLDTMPVETVTQNATSETETLKSLNKRQAAAVIKLESLPQTFKDSIKSSAKPYEIQHYVEGFISLPKEIQTKVTNFEIVIYDMLDYKTQCLVDNFADDGKLVKKDTGLFTFVEQPKLLYKIAYNLRSLSLPYPLKKIALNQWKKDFSFS